jgi:hypothetical protein
MSILKPVLILAILSTSLLCNKAWATDPPPRPGATRPAPAAKPDDAKPAPAKARPRRRAVRQQIDGMPVRPAPPALAMPAAPSVRPPALPQPLPSPQTQDGSYKSGVGNALISPQGKLCSDNGITVQCF